MPDYGPRRWDADTTDWGLANDLPAFAALGPSGGGAILCPTTSANGGGYVYISNESDGSGTDGRIYRVSGNTVSHEANLSFRASYTPIDVGQCFAYSNTLFVNAVIRDAANDNFYEVLSVDLSDLTSAPVGNAPVVNAGDAGESPLYPFGSGFSPPVACNGYIYTQIMLMTAASAWTKRVYRTPDSGASAWENVHQVTGNVYHTDAVTLFKVGNTVFHTWTGNGTVESLLYKSTTGEDGDWTLVGTYEGEILSPLYWDDTVVIADVDGEIKYSTDECATWTAIADAETAGGYPCSYWSKVGNNYWALFGTSYPTVWKFDATTYAGTQVGSALGEYVPALIANIAP